MSDNKPNILLLMADQLTAYALSAYGNKHCKTPNIDKLAEEGVVFENTYCPAPLCAPSRFSFMSGQLASKIGAHDNGAEFPATIPTFAHYLRDEGYYTCLSGKMHFVGPDQLHGFEERLTTDIYPADFAWSGNWDTEGKKYPHEIRKDGVTGLKNVVDAGCYARTLQMDYDEDVFHQANRKIYDLARSSDKRPFLLVTSVTQPHDPYITTKEYWDRYTDEEINLPDVGYIPVEERDPQSQHYFYQQQGEQFDTQNEEVIKKARHGYYGMISYIDDRIGEILQTLEDTGQRENTIIMLTADHGDMMGERGMWYKKTFYDWAMKVPLIVNAPERFAPKRVSHNTSLLDVLPTLLELAGGSSDNLIEPIDGHSLVKLLQEEEVERENVIFAEHLDEGTEGPRVLVRKDNYKYAASLSYSPMLFDMNSDPHELNNLAGIPEFTDIESELAEIVANTWDLQALEEEVLKSQKRRRFVFHSSTKGHYNAWDYQPSTDATKQYIRQGRNITDIEVDAYLKYPK